MAPLILNLVTRISDQLHALAALLSAIEPPMLGPRAGQETVEKRWNFCPCQNWTAFLPSTGSGPNHYVPSELHHSWSSLTCRKHRVYIKVCVQCLLLKWHPCWTYYVVLPWLQIVMFRKLFVLPSSDDNEKYTQSDQIEGSYQWLCIPLKCFFFAWRRKQN